MIRKVVAPQEVTAAAGQVTKELVEWLAARGPGWSVNIVLGRKRGKWYVLEVGNVYP